MSSEAVVVNPENTPGAPDNNPWSGGKSPFAISWGKMYMWLFLVSDAFTFSGLLIAYGTLRHRFIDSWPSANDVFTHFPFYEGHIPLAYVGLMTFILIMSSVTMVLAVDAGHKMNRKSVILWLFLTVIGGLMFVGSQAWEWYHFIVGTEHGRMIDGVMMHGANLVQNEYGHPLFADFFFFITGFHGFHVFSGVVINFIILLNVINGVYDRRGHYEQVEKVGLYWHFVDLVWVFVFTFFYLV
jgi:cytochrome c oxidase subunit III